MTPLRRTRWPIAGVFAWFGAVVGSFAVIALDVQESLGLGPGGFGALLAIGFALGACAQLAGGALVERCGEGGALRRIVLLFAAVLVAAAVAPATTPLAVAVVALLATAGALNATLNACATAAVAGDSRGFVRFHAAFSAGAFGGAVITAIIDSGGASWRLVWLTLALAGSLLAIPAARCREPRPGCACRVAPVDSVGVSPAAHADDSAPRHPLVHCRCRRQRGRHVGGPLPPHRGQRVGGRRCGRIRNRATDCSCGEAPPRAEVERSSCPARGIARLLLAAGLMLECACRSLGRRCRAGRGRSRGRSSSRCCCPAAGSVPGPRPPSPRSVPSASWDLCPAPRSSVGHTRSLGRRQDCWPWPACRDRDRPRRTMVPFR